MSRKPLVQITCPRCGNHWMGPGLRFVICPSCMKIFRRREVSSDDL